MRREKSRTVAEVLHEYIQEENLESGLLCARIFEAWDQVLLDITSSYYTQEEIPGLTLNKFFKDGVLSCKIASSVLRSQFFFQLESIRKRINTMLQEERVLKITIY